MINFPTTPVDNEEFVNAGKTWVYNASLNLWTSVKPPQVSLANYYTSDETNNAISSALAFTPADATKWTNVPTTLSGAVNELASMVEAGGGAGPVDTGLTYMVDFVKANSTQIKTNSNVNLTGAFEIFIDFQRDQGLATDTVLFGSADNASYWVNIDSGDRLVLYFGINCLTSLSLNTLGFLGPQINTLKITRDENWLVTCMINGQAVTGSGTGQTSAGAVVDLSYIGRNRNGAYYDGVLRNFKIYDGGTQFTGNLVLDMPLDDGPFTGTFLDSSPSANHGVSTNITGADLLQYQLDDTVSPNTLTDTGTGTKVFTIANT